VPTGDPPTAALRRAPGDGRTHVVRQGECLWSIAHDQIGQDANPAQVARLVNRLWNLNRERIGTGEPDLLMVGTELRLP
jgi:nucleoid-associated protein YgaU